MLFHLLFFSFVFGSNKAFSADQAQGKYPKHLSFQQYRGILSFASDDDTSFLNELEISENEEQASPTTTITTTIWDSLLSDALDDAEKKKATSATGSKYNNQNYEDTLFPFIACHSDMSEMHGAERYNVLESILARGHEKENDSKFFIKRVPIYNNIKSKTSSDEKDDTLYGTCFYSTIDLILAKNIEEKEILLTPVAPFLKVRKDFSRSLEDDEDSVDRKTISIAVLLAPGVLSSESEILVFAKALQNDLHQYDENDSFLSSCDREVFQRCSITVGSSDMSSYFYYELQKQDLVKGITHRCHKLFVEYIVTQTQVISVEKVSRTTISNFNAGWISQGAIEGEHPWFDAGIDGTGQIVQVSDTGLYEQSCYLRDYNGEEVPLTTGWDLTDKINHNLRKVVQYVAHEDIDSDRFDLAGHGSHLVGSIAGKRLGNNGIEVTGIADGVAPGSKIAFFDGHGENDNDMNIEVNGDISQFFYFARKTDAHISSASWNSQTSGGYTIKSQEIDEYFYGDFDDGILMVNSAGNDGENGSGTVGYPCTSKNVFCIGASHSHGKNLHLNMNGIDEVASFSSRGPTQDGRIKPDVVAVGHAVLSVLANSNECDPNGNEHPQYEGKGINAEHGGLVFKSGTSMSCPIAAGSGALIRQYFMDGFYPSGSKVGEDSLGISGTLLKAIMINGAEAMTARSRSAYGESGYDSSTFYDEFQGYGRINLLKSLKHPSSTYDSPDLYVVNEKIIGKDYTHQYEFRNVCGDHDFRVTLVWRDPPGVQGCNHCLINDLDLQVEALNEVFYPNGRLNKDSKNNVERVILDHSSLSNTENVIVKVRASNLGYTDSTEQKYSLVATGCFNNEEVEFEGPEPNPTCDADQFEYTIEIFTNRKPEETSWLFQYQGSNDIITAARAGQYDKRLHLYRKTGCASYSCFLFIIKDTAFDGLCCVKGMGSYLIRADDEVLIEGDSFVDRQKIEKFCNYGTDAIEPTTSPTTLLCNNDEFKYQIDIETDLFPDETRWVILRKPRIDGVDRGSYTESYREYVHEGCLDLGGCYSFFVYGDGEYTIKANEFGVAEREKNFNGKLEEFCYEESSITPAHGIRTAVVGSNEGYKFDDVHSLWEYGKIKEIELYTEDENVLYTFGYYNVWFIGITYESGQYFEHGQKVGSHYIITLDEDQYITKVSGRADDYIRQLKFERSDGEIFGPYGGDSGDPFEFDFDGNVLVYIFGRSYGELSQLGFTHASLPQTITDSPTAQPTAFPCGDDQFRYEIIIRTDEEPEEIWWELHSIVDSVPFMTYRKQLESYSHTGCLTIDENCEFLMIDRTRDGLCCYFGSGSYKLSVDNNVVVQGNHFDDAIYVGEFDFWFNSPDAFVYNKHEFSYTSTLQPTSKPIQMTCLNDEFEYRIRVRTSSWPEQTRWTFTYSNNTGDIIESVEEGEYIVQHYEHNYRGCISLDECYVFHIESPIGLCCYWGNGGYTVFANDVVMAEGGESDYDYDWSETKTFCYGPSSSQSPSLEPSSSSHPSSRLVCDENEFKYEVIVTTDRFPDETSWELSDDDGTIIENLEEGEYVDGSYEHVHEGCLDHDSCVIFTIFDSLGDGIESPGGYTIKADDAVMAEGGGDNDYWYNQTHEFCYGPSSSFSPSSSDVCENGSSNYYWCGFWASIGACEDNHVQDWMQENCAKACSNCCMDYSEDWYMYDDCDDYASEGRCTDTSQHYTYDFTWQEWMQATCRKSCDTCDLDFTPSPTPPPVTCSDDQFKYEIIFTNDNDDDYYNFEWDLYYKYPDQIDGYEVPEGYVSEYNAGIVDGFSGDFPPNYEKRLYGCASYACFYLKVRRGYLKMYDEDKDILIAESTETAEDLRFCHYNPQPITPPLVEAIITISLEFRTSQLNDEGIISKLVQRSVMKILFRSQIVDENIVTDILDGSCEEESKKCEIIMQICEGPCGEGEEPDFLAFIANTMNEVEANGQLLQTINSTADHMDVAIVDSLTEVSILYNFEYDTWPTTSPTTSPSSTPTQDCNTPAVVQSLFYFITNIFESITQAITNAADPISDVLFGVESYNSSDITCTDKMFELQIEIKTDGSPDKTSWELLYENGTIIDSIVQDTYSECDTVYNHSYCLDTSCFVFNIFDSFEFKGSYNITVGDTVLAQQDSFLWWKDTKYFCYPQCDDDGMFALQLELMTDDWPQETSWDLTFDNGTMVDSVDERYYTQRNTVYNHRYCLRDGCYDVTFHDHIGDGVCCSYGEGSFKMKINDDNVVIREGDEFEESVRKSFCHKTKEISGGENNPSLFGIIIDLFGDESCCTTDTTGYPTPVPSPYPTTSLSLQPSKSSIPSSNPSILPSSNPSVSFNPSVSSNPSSKPSSQPTLQPSSQPSLQPTYTAPPPINDYKIWLDGESWNGIKWQDKSTNEHHSVDIHGTINIALDVNNNLMPYLYGNTNSGVTISSGWPSGNEYTLFHVTKYNGESKELIWTDFDTSWASGHIFGKRGVFWHDWAVALVLVYDRYLDEDEVLSVEDWIRTEYLSTYTASPSTISEVPSFDPTSTSQPSFLKLPPPINDYKIWFDGDSWDGSKWLDKSTNEHHSVDIHGTINRALDQNNSMNYLFGNTNSGVTISSGWPSGNEYTLFHVTKYNGESKELIWTDMDRFWISGHAYGKRGVFWHGGWVTVYQNVGDVNSWGIFTDRVNFSGSNVRVDGVDLTSDSQWKYIPSSISINQHEYPHLYSDWAVALVLVYDRYLDEDEVLSVEDWIRTEYLSS